MKILEFGLWITGALMLAMFVGAHAWAEAERQSAVAAFSNADPTVSVGPGLSPLAVLRIGSIALEVPVYDGTAEHNLYRGAGLVEGTALPGAQGNTGIAAHRDSFFRGLEDVAIGDLIELDTPGGRHAYRVTALTVVEPADIHVLADTGERVVTLVTCFPFYFVGSAPQRYIVRAEAVEAHL
ncbi:MAG: class D sortase [Gammaproteobacteria bacterium]